MLIHALRNKINLNSPRLEVTPKRVFRKAKRELNY